MERVGFGDDGVAGCDGGDEVSSADAVEGEGKVVGAEDDDGADGGEAGADIFFEVEGGVAPGFFAHGGGGLAELVGGTGKLDVFEARCDGESGFFGCGGDDAVGGGFDVCGVSFE